MCELLKINDLDKLKITSITNVIHFKYDNEFYFIHENRNEFYFIHENRDYTNTTAIYKGRTKYKNEYIKSMYGSIINLIKYKNNKKVLSAIDKVNFVEKLYGAGLIDTNNVEIKTSVENKTKRLNELNEIIKNAYEEIRKINWG